MRHHRIHPVAAFLLVLVFGPYLLAVGAILAAVWAVIMIVALLLLPFQARR